MTIRLKKCTLEDSSKLQEISYETFKETFGHKNSPENMNAYLEKAFNLNQLKKELSNQSSEFFFVYLNDEVAGYLKVNTNEAQSEKMGEDAFEIERIYILNKFQKQGLGKYLLNKAIELAMERKKRKFGSVYGKRTQMLSPFTKRQGLFKLVPTRFTWETTNKQTLL